MHIAPLTFLVLLLAGDQALAQGGSPDAASTPRDSAPKQSVAPSSTTAPVGTDKAKDPKSATTSFSESVLSHGGRPVAGAIVRLTGDVDGQHVAKTDTTDAHGRYSFIAFPAGNYEVRITYGKGQTLARRIGILGVQDGTVQLPEEVGRLPEFFATLVFLLLYLASIAATRWHHIARSLHEMVGAQIRALRTRLDTEIEGCVPLGDSVELRKNFHAEAASLVENPASPDAEARRSRVAALEKSVKLAVLNDRLAELDCRQKEWKPTWTEKLFWSRGRENALWTEIHEIERELSAFLAPPEHVESYLRWADAELRAIGKPTAVVVADAIHLELQAPVPEGHAKLARADKVRKALLGRGIGIIYSERDNSFSTLMEWQNKASWLVVTAVVVIGFLSLAEGHAILFLAGAAGGYSSRLMRALKREDVPLDYGASWTTLFLSPLFGALAGWFGIALVSLATQPGINLLGDAFKQVRWDDASSVGSLAVAFLLGFSERLFDAVAGAVDQHGTRTPTRPPAPVLPTTAVKQTQAPDPPAQDPHKDPN
ncbi:MAG TPA: carboxypeptidase-like regulatory domain-containing protein [Longimicrobiaceae bacterium]|jgi:hypothetical protein|nr:carboxypeptidase-like regulatory domain-containing protein [Longimicrobiaceae bacterium]